MALSTGWQCPHWKSKPPLGAGVDMGVTSGLRDCEPRDSLVAGFKAQEDSLGGSKATKL